MMIAVMATTNSKRSTVGSNTLPNSLTWLSRRAGSHDPVGRAEPAKPGGRRLAVATACRYRNSE
jgi:hypothetical protein